MFGRTVAPGQAQSSTQSLKSPIVVCGVCLNIKACSLARYMCILFTKKLCQNVLWWPWHRDRLVIMSEASGISNSKTVQLHAAIVLWNISFKWRNVHWFQVVPLHKCTVYMYLSFGLEKAGRPVLFRTRRYLTGRLRKLLLICNLHDERPEISSKLPSLNTSGCQEQRGLRFASEDGLTHLDRFGELCIWPNDHYNDDEVDWMMCTR